MSEIEVVDGHEPFSGELAEDMVNSPKHYKGDIECIDVMETVFGRTAVRWYCLLNAFKYVWRCTKKHDGETDCVKKAIWYLRYFIGDDPREKK